MYNIAGIDNAYSQEVDRALPNEALYVGLTSYDWDGHQNVSSKEKKMFFEELLPPFPAIFRYIRSGTRANGWFKRDAKSGRVM